ncbi:MAG: alpha/beta fold hydrolase, partial [Nocardioides sp.]
AEGRAAATEGRAEGAAAGFGAALALWRGDALSDVPALAPEAQRLDQQRLAALEGRIEAELALGSHEALVGELTALAGQHPLREHPHALLMTALHRSGRSAEALAVYRDLRSRLVDELGLEPMPDVQELQRRILHRESLDPAPPQSSVDVGSFGSATLAESARDVPETRYARADGIHIAYQVVGGGDTDIVLVPGLLSHLDLWWANHVTASFMRRLASLGRLIVFDKRGSGLSDRPRDPQTLDDRMDDIRLVMEAAGSKRALLVCYSEGGPMGLLFAATHPERVSGLVLTGSAARWSPADDYPCGSGSERMFDALETICEQEWGRGSTIDWYAPSIAGSDKARALVGRRERMSVSPNDFLRMLRMVREIDVRAILGSVKVPVLVFQRTDDRVTPPCHGRYLAGHLPNARYIEGAGDHVIWIGETEPFLGALERFIHEGCEKGSPERLLVVLLSAQLVGPARRGAPSLRDRLLGTLHEDTARSCRLVRSGHDGLLATFDTPVGAIEAALRITAEGARTHDAVRIGIHIGEAGLADGVPTGVSESMTATVAACGAGGQVIVTPSVRDLAIGSPFRFVRRTSAALHPGLEPLPLYAVTRS